jgi:hypothetical protein
MYVGDCEEQVRGSYAPLARFTVSPILGILRTPHFAFDSYFRTLVPSYAFAVKRPSVPASQRCLFRIRHLKGTFVRF